LHGILPVSQASSNKPDFIFCVVCTSCVHQPRPLEFAVFLFGILEVAMRTIIKALADLLNRLAARVSDEDITAAFWRIIFTMIRLAYLSMLLYWLLKLMEVSHKIGII
jgi:hypothetical protein